MAKRKTARPAARTRGRGTAAGRTAAAGGRTRGTTSSSTRRTGGTKTRAKTAKSRKAAAGTRKAAGRTAKGAQGTRKSRKTGAGARQAPASRAASTRGGAKGAARGGAKALPRRQAGAASAPKGRTASATKKPAAPRGARPGRSPSTPPRDSLGKRGGRSRLAAAERDRRLLEETVETPPSSLDFDRKSSAARTGRAELEEALTEHTASGPALTGGDIDADWQSAYSTGDEAPGGDMPTPGQSVVEDIGESVGVEYQDNEELKGVDKIEERDRNRWEYDPASSEDYDDRSRRK